MKFKVTITKTCYVEADDVAEANDKALEGDFIIEDEKVVSTVRITTSQMRRIAVQLEDTE
jgi:hypothetical protein